MILMSDEVTLIDSITVRSFILTITLGEIKGKISKLQIKIDYYQGIVKLKLAIISFLILTISLGEIRVKRYRPPINSLIQFI